MKSRTGVELAQKLVQKFAFWLYISKVIYYLHNTFTPNITGGAINQIFVSSPKDVMMGCLKNASELNW